MNKLQQEAKRARRNVSALKRQLKDQTDPQRQTWLRQAIAVQNEMATGYDKLAAELAAEQAARQTQQLTSQATAQDQSDAPAQQANGGGPST